MKVKLIIVVVVCIFVLLPTGCDKKSPNSPEKKTNEISVTNIRDITYSTEYSVYYFYYDITNNTNTEIIDCTLKFVLKCGNETYTVRDWASYLEPGITREKYATTVTDYPNGLPWCSTVEVEFISYEIT